LPPERGGRGPLGRGEKSTLAAFVVAAALWTLPDLMGMLPGTLPLRGALVSRLPLSVGAIVAAFMLFVLPGDDGRPVLPWRTAAAIDWGAILLFGGGLALGHALTDTGLAEATGRGILALIGSGSTWVVTAIAIACAIALSEVASNTVAATVLVPVVVGLAESAAISPVAPILGVAIGASLGFMMPVSTPPNAIVYGSGLVPARDMMRAGLVIDGLGFIVTWLVLRLLLPPLGLV
jgi:sodium-dependent dicarboxylate transporter 2/3/5